MSTTQPRQISFHTDKAGRRYAQFFSPRALRSFRMPLAEAELLVATGQAVEVTETFSWAGLARQAPQA